MDKKLKDAAVGTGAAAAAIAVGPAAAVVAPAADLVQYLWGRATAARRQAMRDGLLEAVTELGNYEGEEAEHRLDVLLAECTPDQEELVYQSFKAMAFGKSSAAWPYILRITADRLVNHGGAPDTFFRRAAWMLERCEEDDLPMIEAACRASAEFLALAEHVSALGVVWCTADGGRGLTINATKGPGLDAAVPTRVVAPDGFRGADVIGLVQEARFARLTNHERAFISRKYVDKLSTLFR